MNRTTTFTYTGASITVGNTTYNENGLLASISDPLSHTISYGYTIGNFTGTVWCNTITEPAGVNASNNTRTQTWTITTSTGSGSIPFAVTFSGSGGVGGGIAVDLKLRKRWASLGNVYLHVTDYDDTTNPGSNNVSHQGTQGTVWLSGNNYASSAPSLEQWMTYGPHGNVLTSNFVSSGGTPASTSYYNASQYFQKASVTDQNNRTAVIGVGSKYDPTPGNQGSLLFVQDAAYNVSGSPSYHKQFAYTYNQYGQKLTETNMNGVVTNYTYGDTYGNLTQVVQDLGTGHLNRTTTMTYDSVGHVLTSVDTNGKTATFTYNILGQPLSASFQATANTPAETITYVYDANGRTHSVTDNRGTTIFTYENGCDRLKTVTDPVMGDVSYTYGVAGERLTMTLAGGGTWTYGYGSGHAMLPKDDPNSVGKMVTDITDDGASGGRKVSYNFDEVGKLHEVWANQTFSGTTLVSAQYTRNYYNANTCWLSQIQNQWKTQTTTTTLVQNVYTYDNVGQRLTNAISDVNGLVRTETYTYDEVNRLKTVNYGDGQTQSYTFDAMGNRLSKTDTGGGINGTENYTVNAANMLLTRGANSYTNDANGNTLTGGGRTNTWDSQNRLVQCVNGANTSVYTYGSDGIRHRAAVTNGGTTTTTDFILDGPMFVRERRNNANFATYLAGPRGPEYRRDDVAGTVRWYLYDGLGSCTGEVDPNGNITATRKYDVYGAVRSTTGTSTTKHKFVGSLGHPTEDETGFIYMQARYYDPATGRFISEDPGRQGGNWFTYCANSPTTFIDRNGKSWENINEWVNRIKDGTAYTFALLMAYMAFIATQLYSKDAFLGFTLAAFFGTISAICFAIALGAEKNAYLDAAAAQFTGLIVEVLWASGRGEDVEVAAMHGLTAPVFVAITGYGLCLCGALIADLADELK